MMTFLFYFAIMLFLLLALALSGLILIQESKTSGMGASFGGETGQVLFGTSAADILKRCTAWLIVLFFSSCIVLNFWTESLSTPLYLQTPDVELIQ